MQHFKFHASFTFCFILARLYKLDNLEIQKLIHLFQNRTKEAIKLEIFRQSILNKKEVQLFQKEKKRKEKSKRNKLKRKVDRFPLLWTLKIQKQGGQTIRKGAHVSKKQNIIRVLMRVGSRVAGGCICQFYRRPFRHEPEIISILMYVSAYLAQLLASQFCMLISMGNYMHHCTIR